MLVLSVVPRKGNLYSLVVPQPPYVGFAHGWYGTPDAKQPVGAPYSDSPPSYERDLFRPEVVSTIERKLKELSPELRKLSLDIWSRS